MKNLIFALLTMGSVVSYAQNDVFEQTKKANDSSLEGHILQNLDKITAVYTDESILIPPGSEPIIGLKKIRRYYQSGFENGRVIEVSTKNISYSFIDDSHAEEVGSYQMSYLPKGEEKPISIKGYMIITWSKDEEGAWKIIYDMWH